jgi:hypothetical protein
VIPAPSRLRPLLIAGLLAAASTLGACAHRRGDKACRGKSEAQCAWEKAERGDESAPREDRELTGYNPGDPLTPTGQDQWDRATEILGAAWTMMGEGVDRQALAEVARDACAEPPTARTGDEASWTCPLQDAPVLAGRDFILEVGGEGVIALTAFNLGEGESSGLLDEAVGRWKPLCAQDFAPYTPPRASGDFRGCVLNDGPLLVLSRFMPDPETPLWQVSLAVMPAG